MVAIVLLFVVVLAIPLEGGDLEPISSAEFCGRCHRAIYTAWKQSSHARSMESPLFQDALEAAEAELGAAARKTCLGCHAPLALETGDSTLQKKVSWEGVTCDFCHSIREVVNGPGNSHQARLQFNLTKFGSLKEPRPAAHKTAYSAVHSTSAVCAPCHEFRNAQGFPVLTTYSEWQNSRHSKEGRPCQACHMSVVAGKVAEPRAQRTAMAKINVHEMAGSHSVVQLNRTIKASLSAAREGGRVKAVVRIANASAGHYVPTGSPLRQLVLEVRATANNGRSFQQERVYRRVLVGAQGKELPGEHLAFFKSVKQLSDTRLAPDEKRTETFYFDIPAAVQAQVKAKLWYYYSPLATTEAQKRVSFLTLSQAVY